MSTFDRKVTLLQSQYKALITQKNTIQAKGNGVFNRWENPIITAEHTPLFWRYDLNPATNPMLLERLGINATFNSGAMMFDGKYTLVVRVEGVDRKSFFAVAQSENGVDNFKFWDYPITMPETHVPDVNVYDMRLTEHEDGYIYGLFCTERKDMEQAHDPSAAVAECGIARTKNLVDWERLPDLITHSGQQRNVVLHPEFVDGQYALYTRPQDGFISVGSGGGIAWGLLKDMREPEILHETIVDAKAYHTIKEVKNGQGPAPLKTELGWLHLAHGVRNTAAGLRYVLYMFMTDLHKPWIVTHQPAGHFMAPEGQERVGDVSNVCFANGWVEKNGLVHIYYASSDTRMHVATSSLSQLVDYVTNTPADEHSSANSVKQRKRLIDDNLAYLSQFS